MTRKDFALLYVDDDEDDFVVIRSYLKKEIDQQFVLDWSRHYSDALIRLQTNGYDLVLVNHIPGLIHCFDFISRASALKIAPIIYFSDFDQLDDFNEAKSVGAQAAVSKNNLTPVTFSALLQNFLSPQKES